MTDSERSSRKGTPRMSNNAALKDTITQKRKRKAAQTKFNDEMQKLQVDELLDIE